MIYISYNKQLIQNTHISRIASKLNFITSGCLMISYPCRNEKLGSYRLGCAVCTQISCILRAEYLTVEYV